MTPTRPYRRIDPSLWHSAAVRAVTPLAPTAQGLYLYLLTGPRGSVVPGVYPAGPAALAEDLGWTARALERCLAELTAHQLAIVHLATRLIVLPAAIAMNPASSPKQVTSWARALAALPISPVLVAHGQVLRTAIHTDSASFGATFDAALTGASPVLADAIALGKGIGNPDIKGDAIALPETEAITEAKAFPPSPRRGGVRAELSPSERAAFDTLVEAYPSHRRSTAQAAQVAFARALRTAKDAEALVRRVCLSLTLWCQSHEWRSEQGKYVPSLVNWVTEERWCSLPKFASGLHDYTCQVCGERHRYQSEFRDAGWCLSRDGSPYPAPPVRPAPILPAVPPSVPAAQVAS